MPFRSFESFGALRNRGLPPRFTSPRAHEILRVSAEVQATNDQAAANTCRDAIHS